MCGIAGFWDLDGTSPDRAPRVLSAMTGAIRHRGPDDSGVWVDPDGGVALGHRRLSIVDLSPLGHQPMHSGCARFVIIFNGEIYNFKQLRVELEGSGSSFRGHSDTEVLLAAVSRWGMRGAVERFNGMFAFVLWDRRDRVLHLVRDRAGEKPLYYGWFGRTLVFGSELKALAAHPCFRGEVDHDAVALYLRHNYVPSPYSIYRGVRKLAPGTILSIPAAGAPQEAEPTPYWSALEVAEEGLRNQLSLSPEAAADQLDALLLDSVKLRMEADVPLGAFLSGGVDSSLIVALMQAQSGRPVQTFTIGFHEAGYNEAKHAKAVAQHLGTDHTELYVTPHEAMAVIPRLPTLYDEPFSDSSQIPTFLVSELARRRVTVSLSGDGGDELFGGYNRYFWGRRVWKNIGWMPAPIRRASARALSLPDARHWNALERAVGPRLAGRIRGRPLHERARQIAAFLSVRDAGEMYLRLVSHWTDPEAIVRGGRELPTALTRPGAERLSNVTERMMYLDLVSYLPDDILVKVDRASMATSLEARIPLLDHRVIEFAWRTPLDLKVRDSEGKWLLRQVLYRYVPRSLIDRPKMGFGVPLHEWLRGPLRDWAEDLLDPKRLEGEGVFDPSPIRRKWDEHVSCRENWDYHLWDVLMFQAWHEETRRAGSANRDVDISAAAVTA